MSEKIALIEGQIITGKSNKDIEIEQLKDLLKECYQVLDNAYPYQVMDRANHYLKKIENDVYEPLLQKIDEVLK